MTQDPRSPDPDRLLELVQADRSLNARGALKIFFGASAGVGKTYAMLSEAQRVQAEGRDVVIGVAEHHGRPETSALVAGLPEVPQKVLEHRGIPLREFDLDAALARRPQLLLLDELAHSNAPGSRHPKRWQDAEELLANGIDVWTTLNVQHLDSVNDLVARKTGIWVSETVPDRVFDEADEVSLVDLPADDLLKRLAGGKVYVAEGANTRAADNFFKKANLNALREIALRRTAERVDAESEEMDASRTREAPVGPKILVLTGHDALSAQVLRRARSMAAAGRSGWTALYLETDRHLRLGPAGRAAAEANLELAEKLGASVVRLTGGEPVAQVLAYARANGFSRIIAGYRPRSAFARWLQPSLAMQLLARADGLEVTVVSGDGKAEPHPGTRAGDAAPADFRLIRYGLAAAATAACTLAGLPLREVTPSDNLAMIYIAGVVAVAARLGIGPALACSVMSVAAFNFFFTQPYYSLYFYDSKYYFTFALMLVTSLLVGSLTARVSLHAQLAQQREAQARALYRLSKDLSAVRGHGAMAEVASRHIGDAFHAVVRIWLPGEGGLICLPVVAGEGGLDLKDTSAVDWVMKNGQMAGRGTDTMPSAAGLFLPLGTGEGTAGVLALVPRTAGRNFSRPELDQFAVLASLVAGALQRASAAHAAEQDRIEAASEKLRNVLLASLSHDLRTPLTVLNGGLANLLRMRKRLPREAVDELTSLWTQLNRLQKFAGNLLSMAAITSGRIKLNREPWLLQEIVGAAIEQIRPQREDRTVTAAVTGQIPLVDIDGARIGQVLANLLENAIAHTDATGSITVLIEREADHVRVRVRDDGTGLQPGDEERIFDKFRSGAAETGDGQGAGTGLGLAICRGIIEAHGGMIYARNNSARDGGSPKGASFVFTLPVARDVPRDA